MQASPMPSIVLDGMHGFWSAEAIEERRRSVGADHTRPPVPCGLRERLADWRTRRRLYGMYVDARKGTPLALYTYSFKEYSEQYRGGRIDPTTGQITEAAQDESMAALGGPFYVTGDALEVDVALSRIVRQPTMPDGTPWESDAHQHVWIEVGSAGASSTHLHCALCGARP